MTKEQVIQTIKEKLLTNQKNAEMIFAKAVLGGEIQSLKSDLYKPSDLENWLNKRFLPNIVFIDEKGYSEMCVDALKILGTTAATDYGGTRQRDLGQLWADMTRGYLGELAFSIFAKERYNTSITLGHEIGEFEKYLHTDVHSVINDQKERDAKIKISIKSIKMNGIWQDIPGDQFSHSDAYVVVKVGTGRDHLFAFFKKISVFKDKVLKVGQEVGSLTSNEADELFNTLPTFQPIPAYICGFALKKDNYKGLSYGGKVGRKHYTISSWCGPRNAGDLQKIKEKEGIDGEVKFAGIDKFSHDKGYLFNVGNLHWEKADWDVLIRRL